MEASLLVVIALLLFYCAWQQQHHERAMAAAELRWSMEPRLMFIPAPKPAPKPAPEEPFELRRERQPFENYGVDVSYAPTIGVT
jgi:hypothetical protein